jgi:hypothetical protein
MRKFGVFAALILSGMTPSCAQRVVLPPNITAPEAVPNLRPNKIEKSRRVAVIEEGSKNWLAARTRQLDAGARTKRRPEAQAANPETSQAPREAWHNPPSVAALPLPSEHAEPGAPTLALLPPPSEPVEPTFPSAPHPIESAPVEAIVPAPPEPATPTLPSARLATETSSTPETAAPSVSEASPEVMMLPLPEPAEPSFPTAVLITPPPQEPAGSSLPEQEATAAETSVPIHFPELTENLSLRPRADWRDVTETFSIPHRLLSEAFESNPERRFPRLIRDSWPLPIQP